MPTLQKSISLRSREVCDDLVHIETYHPALPRFRFLTKFDAALAAVLFLVALAARWPLIQRGETLLHPDEAVVGIMAQDIAAGRHFPIYFYGQRYMGALEAYVIAAISPLFSNPIHALRMGPALFFGALVVLQYLMLTRWFGHKGALVGAACLLAGSPMFAQWSISARGGYIENLVWGTAILWAYVEWFAFGSLGLLDRKREQRRRFVFGVLIGSGFWINPAIIFFLLPIALHAFLAVVGTAPATLGWIGKAMVGTAHPAFGRGRLPVVALLTVLLLNACWSVCVVDGQVQTVLLLNLLPPAAAIAILGMIPVALLIARRGWIIPRVRTVLNSNIGMIVGALLGAEPAMIYVVQHLYQGRPMDPSLPLGLRPLWQTGETLIYLIKGFPMLFGADPRPFVNHVTVGRDRSVLPLDILFAAVARNANHLALAAALVVGAIFLWTHRREIGRVLSLEPSHYSLEMLLVVGVASSICLFLLGGCTCSFTTIRYLLPLWAFIPGLAAAVFMNSQLRASGRIASLVLFTAWGVGQFCLYQQIGAPHPLRTVSESVTASGLSTAKAEILDAQLLSYLTGQRCRVAEFQPFWPRLGHYDRPCRLPSGLCRYGRPDQGPPAQYIVNTRVWDRTRDWTDLDSPGPPPPETQRTLWPALRHALAEKPDLLLSRRPLMAGYEVFSLRHPLSETGG